MSAAPSTPNLSFEDLVVPDPMNIYGDNDWAEKIKCIRDILDKEIGADLKDLWEQTKPQLDELLGEWKKCSEISSPIGQLRYTWFQGHFMFDLLICPHFSQLDAEQRF